MRQPNPRDIEWVMRGMARAMTGLELPAVEKIAEEVREDAFRVLVATVLSARTQDATTAAASARLFKKARTARRMAELPVPVIARLIYPVSFYRTKARHVKATCEALVARFGGRVPGTMEELLTLPGVGRKTANLVLILGFRSLRNICVDIHVHRISNRLGWVRTRTPEHTEQALYKRVPARWWPYINLYLVTWGQNVCRPTHPRCGDCDVAARCPRVGVTKTGKSRAAHAWRASGVSSGVPAAGPAPSGDEPTTKHRTEENEHAQMVARRRPVDDAGDLDRAAGRRVRAGACTGPHRGD